ncbi:hypothetical protein JAAARDRAFT_260334 [Jaapia argillacea MUCL 33604]|uniref:Uncharacterized protein n=1 Tax=Jaapia argillacea MUCL 33604 TaxID=933084 RepID=A0A067PWF8_9AGAM|nr:hypothetical protein JAAARDRAFT_260334 [Jaapia argillacea MUCL 33604]
MHRSDGDSGSESESNLAVDPSLFVPSEYRRCNIKGCCNHVPPQVAYRWKLCQSCRRRTREYQRHRRGVSSQPNNAVGASGPDDRNKIPSSDQGRADSDDDSDVPLATKAARRSSVKSSPSRPLSGIMIRIKRPKKIVEPPVAKTPRGNQRSES